jgi:predicted  nucleic acid-binding Zn-ribbon protein
MQLGEVYFDISVNSKSIDDSIDSIKNRFKTQSLTLNTIVDDSQLTKLNKHLDLKKRHFNDVQRHFKNNPLKVYTDTSELDKLNKEIERKQKKVTSGNNKSNEDSTPIPVTLVFDKDQTDIFKKFR